MGWEMNSVISASATTSATTSTPLLRQRHRYCDNDTAHDPDIDSVTATPTATTTGTATSTTTATTLLRVRHRRRLRKGEVLVVNEDGLNLKLSPNLEATNLMIERLGAVRASIVTGELLVLTDDEVKAHIANLGPSPTVKPLVGNVLHCRLSQVD
jgi:hypothetical protein